LVDGEETRLVRAGFVIAESSADPVAAGAHHVGDVGCVVPLLELGVAVGQQIVQHDEQDACGVDRQPDISGLDGVQQPAVEDRGILALDRWCGEQGPAAVRGLQVSSCRILDQGEVTSWHGLHAGVRGFIDRDREEARATATCQLEHRWQALGREPAGEVRDRMGGSGRFGQQEQIRHVALQVKCARPECALRSAHGKSAVDDESCAGHVAGCIGCEECDGVSDLFGTPRAAEWHPLEDSVELAVLKLVEHR
jgi:hypothetical protein